MGKSRPQQSTTAVANSMHCFAKTNDGQAGADHPQAPDASRPGRRGKPRQRATCFGAS
ncbi:MAG: hypothetical protein ACAH17_03795 [Candidatus Paceibacterota bacterium]